MARIRTIKPDFWKHEELSALPEATHLLAAALLNYADDAGYFNANPKLIQAECCPLREPSVSIQDSLTQLQDIGWLELGSVCESKRYGRILTFSTHQRINRPTESKISGLPIVWDKSQPTHTQLSEPSPLEGKGKEEERKDAPLSTATSGGLTPERRKEIRDQIFAAVGIVDNPNPSMLNISPIIELMDKGYGLQKDILPVMESIRARGTVTPTTWAYYVKAVTENKSKNGAIPVKAQSKPGPPTVWIDNEDDRWQPLAARWQREHGKPAPAMGSRHERGIGFHFPAEWLFNLIPVPSEVPFGDGK